MTPRTDRSRLLSIAILIAVWFTTLLIVTDGKALTPHDADKDAKPVTRQQALRNKHHRTSVNYHKWVIQHVWGRFATIGLRIAYCETGYRLNASDYADHTHIGMFQMGKGERRKYGHGPGSWAQARAAFAYFKDSGTGPWNASKHCWKRG